MKTRQRILPQILKLALSGVFLLSLSACGVKGDLYLPSAHASYGVIVPFSYTTAHNAV